MTLTLNKVADGFKEKTKDTKNIQSNIKLLNAELLKNLGQAYIDEHGKQPFSILLPIIGEISSNLHTNHRHAKNLLNVEDNATRTKYG